jgi:hypothetical protein
MGRRLNAQVHLVDPDTGEGKWFRPGDDVPKWAAELIPDVGWDDDKSDEDEVDVSGFHTGGGWYDIDGERVRGEDAARDLLAGK